MLVDKAAHSSEIVNFHLISRALPTGKSKSHFIKRHLRSRPSSHHLRSWGNTRRGPASVIVKHLPSGYSPNLIVVYKPCEKAKPDIASKYNNKEGFYVKET